MLAIFVFQSMMNLIELKWQSSPSKCIRSHTNSIWLEMKVQRVRGTQMEEGTRSNTYSGVQRAAPPPLQRINLQRAPVRKRVPLLPSRAAQEPSVWKNRRWRIQMNDFSQRVRASFWKSRTDLLEICWIRTSVLCYDTVSVNCCRSVISATQMNNNFFVKLYIFRCPCYYC